MAENICLMVTTENEYVYTLTRAVEMAVVAVATGKRTVIYLDLSWTQFAKAGALEKRSDTRESAVKLRSFLNAGGQLWVSRFTAPAYSFKLDKDPLIEGAQMVDDTTLLNFLMQDTLLITF